MDIITQIQNLMFSLHAKKNASEVAQIFNRERKWFYTRQWAESFVINADFVAGLDSLGYQLVLRKKER